MVRFITKYFLSKFLFAAWFAATLLPLLLLSWFIRQHEDLRSTLSWVIGCWGLLSLFGSLWLGQTTAHYMVEENQLLLTAVKRTLYDVRLRLAFVPIIGCWFTPDEDNTSYE